MSDEPLRRRLAGWIRDYGDQGNHWTGSDVDRTSAEWLCGAAHNAGFEPILEPVPFDRVEPLTAHVE